MADKDKPFAVYEGSELPEGGIDRSDDLLPPEDRFTDEERARPRLNWLNQSADLALRESRGRIPAGPTAHFIAEIRMYGLDEGGIAQLHPGPPVPRLPAMISLDKPLNGWTVFLMIGDEPLKAGETRKVGVAVITESGAAVLRAAGRFFLWSGRPFAEAQIITGEDP